ncbi:Dehydrin [Arabidopsis thaliana x Arabidopsis arenosa]|uniref:Dehydrin n=1 Tax=Arabidopsis thaliana x Arabidopsis arenosa TaxID=1240361 RepID=A0A8T2C5M8_9BRAS|nr:Dehydrin [Arabidopsis thaliana x Arabidopsis arenosa]
MAEEYKNTVPEHETPKVATEESPATTTEVTGRGLFDFLGKKEEEVKPQETTTLESEFDHKAQISEPELVAEHEEVKENKITLLEELQEKTEEDEQNKPSVIEKLHRSNSSASSSSDEEGEEKKEKKKKIVEGEEEKQGLAEKIKEKLPGHHDKKPEDDVPVSTTIPVPVSESVVEHDQPEEEKKGLVEKIKEKLPGHHDKTPEDSPAVTSTPLVVTEHPVEPTTEHPVEHPEEKKGILEKIKEKLPGYHAKTTEEEVKKEKETDD